MSEQKIKKPHRPYRRKETEEEAVISPEDIQTITPASTPIESPTPPPALENNNPQASGSTPAPNAEPIAPTPTTAVSVAPSPPKAPIHYSQQNNRNQNQDRYYHKEEPAVVSWNEYSQNTREELLQKLEEYNQPGLEKLKDMDLAYLLMKQKVEKAGFVFQIGALDVLPDGFGFLRVRNYLPGPNDVYISAALIKRFNLNTGDKIAAQVRIPKDGERYYSVLRVEVVNNQLPETMQHRPHFNNLTPIYPDQKFKLDQSHKNITARLIDLIAPIGKGQRGLIVSPPKAGKTTILKDIAHAITESHPEVMIKVLLIDERPEEVTDMQRSIKGEVLYSTFDEPPENHVKLSELVMQSARRMVECGKDVLVLLDSITRLARAYNLVVPPSGRTLSGGLDPSSLHKPKRFFGGARNIEGGGSLTILATALVDTGSRMDDVIYEEFKGTGNMELHLDRKLANRRIFPAIDILASGTRKEELLMDENTLNKITVLRRNIDSENAVEELIKLLKHSKTNQEFLNSGIFG